MENFLIDIGTCTGEFTDSWFRLNPDGMVLCIEPHPENYNLLVKKYASNPNIKVLQAAVALEKTSERIKFYYGTTNQNGSLCVQNEAQVTIQYGIDQGAWPEMSYEEVDAICINDILRDIKSDDMCLTLKIDVEGLEFRIINMISDDLAPDILYLEDSCSKSRNKDEWSARVKYFNKIKLQGTENINIEKRPIDSDEYILNYSNIANYIKYQCLDNIEKIQHPILSVAQQYADKIYQDLSDREFDIDRVEFPFYMTNCHLALIHTKDGKVGETRSEDPLFRAEWADWIYDSVTCIIVKPDMSISCEVKSMVEKSI